MGVSECLTILQVDTMDGGQTENKIVIVEEKQMLQSANLQFELWTLFKCIVGKFVWKQCLRCCVQRNIAKIYIEIVRF